MKSYQSFKTFKMLIFCQFCYTHPPQVLNTDRLFNVLFTHWVTKMNQVFRIIALQAQDFPMAFPGFYFNMYYM